MNYAELNKYVVRGCRQGYGMDADKFYDVAVEYDAKTIDEARQMASDDGIWVESIQEIDGEDD